MENIFTKKMLDKSDAELRNILENRENYQEEAYEAALYELERRRKAALNTPPAKVQEVETPVEEEEETNKRKSFREVVEALIPDTNYYVTPIIIYLNILIYVVMVLMGVHPVEPSIEALIDWGGNLRELTLVDEQWRLLSSTFLHGGIFHLLLNMYALLFIGKEIETQIGSSKFLFAYLFTGVLASVASVAINDNIVSVGASGAIFGMYGVLISLLLLKAIELPQETRKNFVTSVFSFVGYNLAFGFTKEGIDNAAHIGGLVSGLIIGAAYYVTNNKTHGTKAVMTTSTLAVVLLIAALPVIIPNQLGKYNVLMNQFVETEEKALSFSNLQSNAGDDTYFRVITEEGIPNWKKCLSIVKQLDSIDDLPADYKEQNALLKRYCQYRLESFELMAKTISEETYQYNELLQNYNKTIEFIVQKLQGESVPDSLLVVPLTNSSGEDL
ncbi:rhomboid family intramembrane serine protease [Carboxylicivirga sediminis]|uniref:Rhomboid family intramembrane serine protease n=1 Tax=Carboxylicivirga sediminis TaxID=2006564 RepID=A0A941IZX9_9BACT|nr:rhomboid family intramembrane serine protease [Carboxylicivirga sediminis]MBR8537793.1 rhomboid family intramembrane serine protease [Carboxylicivirga sediminis]